MFFFLLQPPFPHLSCVIQDVNLNLRDQKERLRHSSPVRAQHGAVHRETEHTYRHIRVHRHTHTHLPAVIPLLCAEKTFCPYGLPTASLTARPPPSFWLSVFLKLQQDAFIFLSLLFYFFRLTLLSASSNITLHPTALNHTEKFEMGFPTTPAPISQRCLVYNATQLNQIANSYWYC